MQYKPQEIEPKWQKFWEENDFYKAQDFSKKPKKYVLIEFPYPSGVGLHVGHCRSYSAFDAIARKYRMQGFNVMFPIGWDAFGLPTENYAIKTGIHPIEVTKKNIANYTRQLKSLGFSFDWSREVNTTDPKYYKWTQWIFLKLFENGLAYQDEMPINWCPSCKIGLANEEVIDGKCERCKAKVSQKKLKQWMLKITKYADRLIEDLEKVDYSERIKAQQLEWIGRSYGVDIDFKIENSSDIVSVFTTRADTIFGVTAIVLAPEHELIGKLITNENKGAVEKYIKQSKNKTEFERTKLEKEKTGIFTGSYCINPINNEKIPVWIGDYVVATYGGGAVMIVPAHDKRDYDFAKKYNLEIREVIKGGDVSKQAFVEYGTLVNSGEFNGLKSEQAIKKITKWFENKKLGKKQIRYKLRDWIFSRQHYWGEPIPIIHCEKCGVVPVSEKDLPVELPYVKKYEPTDTGESPLAGISDWVNVKCPKCKSSAKRETDTMPNWAGSNWYFLRYVDPKNDKQIADKKKLNYWMPVDWYNGGMEHTTLHLLYSRFIYKFLYDIKVVSQPEPYAKRTSHGIVLAEDNRKMSKSFGNIINPDNIVKEHGADTLRVYEMFMGPFEQAISWSSKGVKGVNRFLNRVWQLTLDCFENEKSSDNAIKEIHKLNRKVEADMEKMKFNTAVAAFMEFINFGFKNKDSIGKDVIERMLFLLAPFAPHITEELWRKMGNKDSIHNQSWPKYDKKLAEEKTITLIIQINGRVRDKIEVEVDISEDEARDLTLNREKVKKRILGKSIKKIIFVPGKLINIVI
ncbi:MAG: leucine--tRNA ligase [Candidatus Nealsonbacteria bacterium]